MMKLLALLATAAALKQPLQKPLAVRGGGIDKAGVVKAVNIAWGFYAAQMILVPSKVHNDHFEEKSTKMTEFWARGHGVSIAVGIYALTQLDTDTAFKAAMAWVAGIGIAYSINWTRNRTSGLDHSPTSRGTMAVGFFLLAFAFFSVIRGTFSNTIWWMFTVTIGATVLGLVMAVLSQRAGRWLSLIHI